MIIFLPQFSCPLELRASFLRLAGFDDLASIAHHGPSRLFFLLTSSRRLSGTVSEILNVAPLDQYLSTDVRHAFRSQTRGPEPGARKTPGFQPLRWRRNHRRFLEHNVVRAFRLPARIPSRNGCLPSFAARGMMTAVVLGDGR
jgi:IS5 family transposase